MEYFLGTPPIAETIIETVCLICGVTRKQIIGPRGPVYVSTPRMLIMYLLRVYVKLSYPTIGHLLGGRDHTTVMSGERKIRKLMAEKPDFRRRVLEIETTLGFAEQPASEHPFLGAGI